MIRFLKRQIKKIYVNNLAIPDQLKSLERLKSLGYAPGLIFDVGAYEGQFAKMCIRVWPETTIVCFEPLSAKVKILEGLAAHDKRIRVVSDIVGDIDQDNVVFHEGKTASSVLAEHCSTDFTVSRKSMRTLDHMIDDDLALGTPSLLKIDTQGFEYQVIQGIAKHLDSVEVILAELNYLDIHQNVKLAYDVMELLNRHGFTVYDICELHRRPLDLALWQVDYLFVKHDSVFRKNKAWIQ